MFKKKPITTRVYRYYREHQSEVAEVVQRESRLIHRLLKPLKHHILSVLSKLPIALPHRHNPAWKRTIRHWRQRRRMVFAVASAFILLVLPTIYLTLRNPKETEAAPWATTAGSWTKRKQVTLTNNSGQTFEANTTYAVNINTQELVTAGYLNSDCSDLRIYYQPDENTTTKLAYYFDTAAGATNCSDSTSTKVYFPLQANLSNSSSTGAYYIYYGNTAAASEASVDAFDVGSTQALMVCPFNGDTDCINGDGSEAPTTETGAIRYGGSKSALSFDDNNDYVQTASDPLANGYENTTVEMWIYFDHNPPSGSNFAGSSGNSNWTLNLKTDGKVQTKFGSSASFVTSSSALSTGSWHHVAVSIDDTNFTLYIDGQSQGSQAISTFGSNVMNIGDGSWGGQHYVDMIIDEVRVSDVKRYTSNFTPQTTPFVRDDHTKLLYHFDENGDDPRNSGKAIDDSGNGNNGTITGAKYVSGLVGVDASTSDSGNVPSQSFADHSGVFIEEGTTNLVTNPSFENGTFDTGWDYVTDSINNSTITTSSTLNGTDIPALRKTWYDGTYYWQALNANSRIEFWYSTDGITWTENTGARISTNTFGFTVVGDSTNFFILYQSSYSIGMSHAISYPSTSFTWSSITYPCSGSNPFTACGAFSLTRDSSGYLWIIYMKAALENSTLYYKKASNPNDETAWGSQTALSSLVAVGNYSSIVSLGNNKLYVVWTDSTNIFGKYYDGSSWDSSPTTIGTFVASGKNLSLTSDSSGNAHLVYGNSSDQIIYQEYTTSWQSAVTLDSNSSNETPTITIDPSSGTLYAFWINNDDIIYKTASSPYTSGYWDASPTTLESNGVNNYLTSGLNTYTTGGPFLAWTEGTANPYNVKFANFVSGNLTITENTTAPYYKFGSKSAKIVASGTGANNFTTSIDPNSTASHTLSAYVYNGTTGAIGGTVDNTVAQLVWEGTAQSGTTYTDMGGGWWRLTYTAATTDASNEYGIYVLDTKTIYVDGVQLEALKYATSYTDGSLGSGYSWSGTANASTSSRTTEDLRYTTTSNISASAGTVSFWIKPNWNGGDNFGSGYQRRSFLASMDYYGGTGFRFTADSDSSGNSYDSIYFASASSGSRVVNTTITSGKWYHVVGTWGGGQATLYVNNTSSGAGSFSMALQASLYVGRWGQGINGNNVISDLRVLDTELSSTQIADLYYSGLGSHQVQSDYTERFSGTEAPVLTWHLDEGYGTTAHDTTIKGNDGTISGAVWTSDTYGSPKQGKSLQFDGSNDYAYRTYSNDDELDPGKLPFSVSTWFKSPSSTGSQHNLISRYNSSGYKLYMNSSGNICFAVDDDSTWSPDDSTCTAASLADSKWHLVTAVRDTSTISVFIDGVQAASTATTVTGHLSGSAPTLYVGIDSDGTSNPWSGFIDEVRIYNHALTTAEILAEVSARGSVKGVSTAYATEANQGSLAQGLVGYWKMDENTGTNLVDSSGNGNSGTGTNGPTWVSGKYGSGQFFDGSGTADDYITIAASSSINNLPQSQFTWSTWFKADGWGEGGQGFLITKGGSSGPAINLRSGATDILVTVKCSTTDATSQYNGFSPDSTWHQMTITYNDSTDRKIHIFMDGVDKTEDIVPCAGNVNTDSSYPITIGNSSGVRTFDGTIDETRIYNRALSPAEVQALYNFAPGPMLYYQFEDSPGTTVADSSGTGLTGTSTGSPTTTTGKFGSGLLYNGSSMYTTANTEGATLSSNAFTSSAWVYRTSDSGNYEAVISNLDGFQDGWAMRINNSDQVECNYNTTQNYSTATLGLNTWYYITCTSDGSNLKVFINGIQADSDAISGSISESTNLSIATASYFPATYFTGKIDDIKVYNYTRTPQQIVSDMNAGHPAPGSPVGSPLVYYKMDEGYGETLHNEGNLGSSADADFAGSCPGDATCPSWTTQGYSGKAVGFDGSNDYASATVPNWLDQGKGSWAISTWMKRTGSLVGPALAVGKTGFHSGIALGAGDNINCTLVNTSNTYYSVNSGSLPIDTWEYLTCQYNADTNLVQFYINGTKVGENTFSGTIRDFSDTVYLGGNSVPQPANIQLDEVKLYSSTLTDSQIAAEYNMGKAAVLGSLSTTASGNASNSSDRSYCPPGDTTGTCGPIGEWKFDENTGTSTVYDTSGSGNNGSMNGGMTESDWVPGKLGSALDFDGNDYILVVDNDALDITETVTLQAWVKPASLPNYATIMGKRSSGSTSANYAMRMGNGGNTDELEFYYANSGWHVYTTSNANLVANQWYLITAIYDGSAVKIYKNGILLSGSCAAGTCNTTMLADTNDFGIGRAGNLGSEYFSGLIDQAQVFNYARSPEQIAWDYNHGKPLLHYKFDECSGSTLHSSNETYYSSLDSTWSGSSGTQTSVGDCSTGGTAWGNGTTGKSNGSLNFDGSDDKVQVVQPVTQDRFSYSFWMKPSSLPGSSAYVVSEGYPYTNTNYILLNSSGNLDFRIFSSQIATSNGPISTGNWYHVVGTYDGTNGKLYINGQLVNTAAATKGGTPDRFSIGGGANGTNFFSGQIDEVKVFSYALSQQQVLTDYNAGAVNYAN